MSPETDRANLGVMTITLIVAMARGGVIGRDGGLPWHLPADLKHFKAVTMGKPIIMGRATHESIGRALPGRHNIVLTRQADYHAEGCTVVHTPDEALAAAGEAEEIMVIGGAAIYAAFLPLATRLLITEVGADCPGDTLFPPVDGAEWREASRESHPADEKNAHPYAFVLLERRSSASGNATGDNT